MTAMIIKSVRQIIEGRDIPQTSPNVTVREACHALDHMNVGALAVVDVDKLVGVFSERDVIRKCICRQRPTAETLVADIMTADPVTIDVEGSLSDALAIMTEGGFRHMPVLEAGKTVGLLSMRDIPTEYRLMLERYQEYVNGEVTA
jgi:CBS domain-containing protein